MRNWAASRSGSASGSLPPAERMHLLWAPEVCHGCNYEPHCILRLLVVLRCTRCGCLRCTDCGCRETYCSTKTFFLSSVEHHNKAKIWLSWNEMRCYLVKYVCILNPVLMYPCFWGMLLTVSTTATGHMENLNLDMDSSELQLYYLSICMVGCKDGCVNSVEICHPSNDGSTQMFLHG